MFQFVCHPGHLYFRFVTTPRKKYQKETFQSIVGVASHFKGAPTAMFPNKAQFHGNTSLTFSPPITLRDNVCFDRRLTLQRQQTLVDVLCCRKNIEDIK